MPTFRTIVMENFVGALLALAFLTAGVILVMYRSHQSKLRKLIKEHLRLQRAMIESAVNSAVEDLITLNDVQDHLDEHYSSSRHIRKTYATRAELKAHKAEVRIMVDSAVAHLVDLEQVQEHLDLHYKSGKHLRNNYATKEALESRFDALAKAIQGKSTDTVAEVRDKPSSIRETSETPTLVQEPSSKKALVRQTSETPTLVQEPSSKKALVRSTAAPTGK